MERARGKIMLTIAIIVIIAIALLIALILWNFPWILRYYSLEVHYQRIIDNLSVVIISDIHAGSGKEDLVSLERVLKSLKADVIVIAGDLFEFEHKPADITKLKILIKNFLGKISLNQFVKMFYVVSSSSHDPILKKKVIQFNINGNMIIVIKGVLKLEISGVLVYVTHGDYACRDGVIANLLNKISLRLRRTPWMECKLRRIIGVKRDEWLIAGHTHIPLIDHGLKVANCGSWKSYWRKGGKSLIIIRNGKIELKSYA